MWKNRFTTVLLYQFGFTSCELSNQLGPIALPYLSDCSFWFGAVLLAQTCLSETLGLFFFFSSSPIYFIRLKQWNQCISEMNTKRIFTFLRWIPNIFHQMCLNYQHFHECVARVKLKIFSIHEMKYFGINQKKVNFLLILYLSDNNGKQTTSIITSS